MFARIGAVLILLLVTSGTLGQALIDRVPADAIVYVGWRGVNDLGSAYPQSNLKAMLDDCDVRQFIDEFLPQVMDRISRENPQAGEVAKIVAAVAKPSWQSPTAFFFAGIDLPANGPPVPHLGVLWQPGAQADALARQLEQLTSQAPAPFPIKVVQADGLVALMVGYDNPRAALGGGGNKSLADNAAYKSALAHVMKDPVAAIYVDYQKVLDVINSGMKLADPNAGEMFGKVREKMGLNGLKKIIATSGFDGKDWGTMAFVEAPEPRTGILKMMDAKPLDNDIMTAIPRTATMAGAARADLSPFLPTIRETIRSLHPQMADQLDQFLNDITKQSGVDLEKDVINSLGDEWAYFTDPAIGGSGLASITIVNRLKDPARFERSLSGIEDFALKLIEQQMGGAGPQIHLAFETVKIDGMTVHYLAVPLVAPCWVVNNGTLYCAAFPQVAAAAARRGSDSGSSILQNPAFTAMKTRLGHAEVTGFGFADLPRTAPNAYGSWLMITRLSGFADLFGVKSPPILLPELGKLLGHLSPAGSVKWVDAEGAHIRSVEPFPASTLVASDPAITAIYAEPILVSIMLPALSKAREQASRVKSANNLRQIGLGCIMYANNHNGRFPPDLETLVQQEDLTAAVFSNPRAPHGPPPPPADRKAMAQWVKDNSDYTYVGAGKKIDAGADTIIAYEKPDQATDGINIVFADGHVEWVEMPRARNMVQNAK